MPKEYIEREATCKECVRYGLEEIMLCADCVVKTAPAADVVEVVRCKDCVNGTLFHIPSKGGEKVDCIFDDYSMRELNDFCSYGARKDGE